MQTAKTLKEYKQKVDEALDNAFQRKALDNFALAYPVGRANAFAGLDVEDLIATVADIKNRGLQQMDALFDRFKANAEKKGIKVHLASTAQEANAIIARIAREGGVRRIVKSKSMTAEETLLNHHLEAAGAGGDGKPILANGLSSCGTRGPPHMVMPAIHLSRDQVADLFSEVTGSKQETEIERLVKVARRELRQKFVEADMGISGANFAIADTATIGLTTNEGNARLVTTLPRIHVALVGLDKLLPTLDGALAINRVLPRNATGQVITSYVTWITGPNETEGTVSGKKEMHIVFLDNGRRELAKDPVFSQVLRCVRCGACANVCPVYRMVGGHQYGHIYIGAIGLIVTYFFHGRDKAMNLVQNCINCGACKAVCAAGIDLPRLIKEIHARIQDETDHPLSSVLLGKLLANRGLFHRLLRTASKAQAPAVKKDGYLRHLPHDSIQGTQFQGAARHCQNPVSRSLASPAPIRAGRPEKSGPFFRMRSGFRLPGTVGGRPEGDDAFRCGCLVSHGAVLLRFAGDDDGRKNGRAGGGPAQHPGHAASIRGRHRDLVRLLCLAPQARLFESFGRRSRNGGGGEGLFRQGDGLQQLRERCSRGPPGGPSGLRIPGPPTTPPAIFAGAWA